MAKDVIEGEGFAVIPAKREDENKLDILIRAFMAGDGATIHENRAEIQALLCELRRYRIVFRCSKCGIGLIGTDPVCGLCAKAVKP